MAKYILNRQTALPALNKIMLDYFNYTKTDPNNNLSPNIFESIDVLTFKKMMGQIWKIIFVTTPIPFENIQTITLFKLIEKIKHAISTYGHFIQPVTTQREGISYSTLYASNIIYLLNNLLQFDTEYFKQISEQYPDISNFFVEISTRTALPTRLLREDNATAFVRIDFGEHIFKPSIASRYAMLKKNEYSSIPQNLIVDNYMPYLLYQAADKYLMSRATLFYNTKQVTSKTSVTVSKFYEAVAGIPRIGIDEQLRILGYKPTEVKKLLLAVKAKKVSPIFLGLGGMNFNVIQYLLELSDTYNVINLFDKITFYERDTYEAHNLLRFSINPYLPSNSFYSKSTSVAGSQNNPILAKYLPYFRSDLTPHSEQERRTINIASMRYENVLNNVLLRNRYASNELIEIDDVYGGYLNKLSLLDFTEVSKLSTAVPRVLVRYFSPRDIYSLQSMYTKLPKYVLFGAPTISFREAWYKHEESDNVPFYCATHYQDTVSLYMTPKVNDTLQIETYGSIKLTQFMLNVLDVTIQWLKCLAEDAPLVKDTLLYESTFDISKSKATRKYAIAYPQEDIVNVLAQQGI